MVGGSGSKKRSRRKQKRKRRRKPNPATQLTDDLLVEILSRVPYPLCRFRCVSTRWRALISGPDYQRRLPQTLAGIFHRRLITPVRYCFTNVSGIGHPLIDPSFPFLPDRKRERLFLEDSCNGILLCQSFRCTEANEFDYLVVNPATEKWDTVPWRWSNKVQTVRLGFDPAFSSHFYIFEFQLDVDDEDDDDDDGGGHVLGVKI